MLAIMPMLRDGDEGLIGHIALANDLHRLVTDGAPALTMFGGEDGYIAQLVSGEGGMKVVPTWGWVVHMHGKISFDHDEGEARHCRQADNASSGRRMAICWKMADAPADFMAEQLGAIVGFRIDIARIEAKSKLSQNRAREDFDGVRRELGARGKGDLARRMDSIADADQMK